MVIFNQFRFLPCQMKYYRGATFKNLRIHLPFWLFQIPVLKKQLLADFLWLKVLNLPCGSFKCRQILFWTLKWYDRPIFKIKCGFFYFFKTIFNRPYLHKGDNQILLFDTSLTSCFALKGQILFLEKQTGLFYPASLLWFLTRIMVKNNFLW